LRERALEQAMKRTTASRGATGGRERFALWPQGREWPAQWSPDWPAMAASPLGPRSAGHRLAKCNLFNLSMNIHKASSVGPASRKWMPKGLASGLAHGTWFACASCGRSQTFGWPPTSQPASQPAALAALGGPVHFRLRAKTKRTKWSSSDG